MLHASERLLMFSPSIQQSSRRLKLYMDICSILRTSLHALYRSPVTVYAMPYVSESCYRLSFRRIGQF
jgi:hypothetical protein